MSIVNNESLQSADSLELVIFPIQLDIDSASQSIDIYSRHRSYWKSCIIRNLQLTDILQFRINPNDEFKTVNPNSELPLKGWGSYLEVASGAATPAGRVDFECVRLENALRR